MSKEYYIEALEQIIEYITEDKKVKYKATILFDCKTIKKALERLEVIDNANPSEALECSLKLYKMVESAGNDNGFNLNEAWKYNNTIKQALLKLDFLEDAMDLPTNCFSTFKNRNDDEVTVMRKEIYEKYQEQEKALRIVFEKNVDIWLLKSCLTVEQYNFSITKIDNCKVFNLTQEEFDLVKRYANG